MKLREAAFHLINSEGRGGDNYFIRGIKKGNSASENPQRRGRRGDQQIFRSGKVQEGVSVVAVTLDCSLPIFPKFQEAGKQHGNCVKLLQFNVRVECAVAAAALLQREKVILTSNILSACLS